LSVEDFLLTSRDEGILTVILNRPHAMNAITGAMAQAFCALLEDVGSQRDIALLMLTGAGQRAFSAGADLKERKAMTRDELADRNRKIHRACDMLELLPQPTICAISGYCLGGGLELALAADIRVAADTAQFGFPEMFQGAFPGAGGPVRLPRVVGPAWAKEIIFTGRRVSAEEARALGLVHYVVPQLEVAERARTIAGQILRASPRSVRAVKQIVNRGIVMSVEDATAYARALREPLEASQDYEEGLRAHFEKREPRFTGE
jgi:enoyl-CoA hydratase/carnithine racemase